ncbi:hypothetical protein NKE60_09720 [Streptococcus suis]|uniref:hypothetical protein n=1 Tax=Streptococcus suis TaxID=1307 RepID=UPI00209B16D8|nr:hypothetical protein [Streptococcus suis]MCO8184983.1 hypothetical protein [Streptococcus suis]MCO8216546.1 hypothetical protein [Streptococcus suis]HEM3496838.1 hypothetical protein [Streptococcus suis]HEM3509950.1 hypothetical protein [Streptococcus suis]
MTKETKLTAEQTLANIKEFQKNLHGASALGVVTAELGLFGGTKAHAMVCSALHDVSHALDKVIKGAAPDEALKTAFDIDGVDEDGKDTGDEPTESMFAGQIAVNVKTGEIQGIESITDQKLKSQLATVVQDVANKLKGE